MAVQLSRGLDCGPTNRMITIIRMDPSIVVHNLFDFLSSSCIAFPSQLEIVWIFSKKALGECFVYTFLSLSLLPRDSNLSIHLKAKPQTSSATNPKASLALLCRNDLTFFSFFLSYQFQVSST
jgi:hypothetical protein